MQVEGIVYKQMQEWQTCLPNETTVAGNWQGRDYRGCQTSSRGGNACMRWDQTENWKPRNYPGAGLEENYCRNPDGVETVWCWLANGFKEDGRAWAFCRDPIEPTGGWYDGGEDQSCSAGCERRGLSCTDERMNGTHRKVDSSAKVLALMDKAGANSSATSCFAAGDDPSSAAAPSWNSDACWQFKPKVSCPHLSVCRTLPPFSTSCSTLPPGGRGVHRLCYCHEVITYVTAEEGPACPGNASTLSLNACRHAALDKRLRFHFSSSDRIPSGCSLSGPSDNRVWWGQYDGGQGGGDGFSRRLCRA